MCDKEFDGMKLNKTYKKFVELTRLNFLNTFKVLEKDGIFPGQTKVLLFLSNNNNVSQKELADKLGVQPATLTVMLKKMAEAKIIERKRDKLDKRIIRVKLTNKGLDISKLAHASIETVSEQFLKGFVKEEEQMLDEFLKRIINNMKKEREYK